MANNLKYLRLRADMSQEEVGKKIGITKQYISAIENEKVPLTTRYRMRLAKAYGISEDEIEATFISKKI